MVDWKTEVDITDLHDGFLKGDISIEEVGKGVASRLRRNKYSHDEELLSLIENLEAGGYDADGYDDILSDIYDFANYHHRIWIKTM